MNILFQIFICFFVIQCSTEQYIIGDTERSYCGSWFGIYTYLDERQYPLTCQPFENNDFMCSDYGDQTYNQDDCLYCTEDEYVVFEGNCIECNIEGCKNDECFVDSVGNVHCGACEEDGFDNIGYLDVMGRTGKA